MKRFHGVGSGLTMCAALIGWTAATGCGGSNPSSTGTPQDGGPDAPVQDAGPGADGSNADAGDDGSQPMQGDAGVDATGMDAGGMDAGGDATAPDGSTAGTHTIGGTVTGLTGTGLVLQDNAGDNLTIASNGAFTFPSAMADGSSYAVTVLTQPGAPSQTCTVTGASGTIVGSDITNVSVACTTSSFTVGGTASGLTGTIVLLDNGGDALSLGADGAFTFATPIASGSAYAITVQSQPAGQTCSVAGATGTIGAGDVTSVVVNCAPNAHTVGGTVSGLTGTVVLQDEGGDNLTLSANGTFAFATPLANGAPYAVTILTQPAGETCAVTGGSGTVGAADVTSVAVTCTANLHTIGGTVTGLAAGASITLQDNRGDNLTQTSNGTFTFSAPLATGASYNVTVSAQPSGQRCTVSGGSGTVGSGDVTSVVVDCAANMYTVGGAISGLSGSVVLQDNGGDNLTLTANGTFAFPTTLATGGMYAVTVLTQPANETCVVTNGSGAITATNVTNIAVTCSGALHTIGGSLSGLPSGASITLQDNGGNNTTLMANGAFSFSQKLADGAAYNVTVLAAPPGETCSVSGGSGTVSGDVTGVSVTCSPKLYSIGGNLQGLAAGNSITLQDNGADSLTLTATGPYVFPTKLASGATYNVTVSAQPTGQACTVIGGAGTVTLTNVGNVIVNCH